MQPKQFCAKLEDLHTAIASDPEACTRELDQLRRWLKPRAVEKVPLGSEGTFLRPAAPATQSPPFYPKERLPRARLGSLADRHPRASAYPGLYLARMAKRLPPAG